MVSFCDIHESSTQVCVASFVECLSRGRQQLGHAHHVVAEHAQLHEPGHFGASTQFGPAQQSILLAPTEAFLDAFAKTLTDPVASVPRGARIDRGATASVDVLCHLWGDLSFAQRSHELARVVAFICRQRATTPGMLPIEHLDRRLAFGRTACERELHLHHQAMAMFYQHVAW